jgi:hypothetical protein
MLLSIGNVKSTTLLNFSWTDSWAKAIVGVPNASESKTSIRAVIMIVLLTVLATRGLFIETVGHRIGSDERFDRGLRSPS